MKGNTKVTVEDIINVWERRKKPKKVISKETGVRLANVYHILHQVERYLVGSIKIKVQTSDVWKQAMAKLSQPKTNGHAVPPPSRTFRQSWAVGGSD